GRVQGHVYFDEEIIEFEPVTRDTLKKKLITMLGGLAGEEVMCGDVRHTRYIVLALALVLALVLV
ncbi:MAG: hypothetical protein II221_00870, partial [Paludibacteraceae bacterium]|nr:hypothetical protein [Paludibacteraceae bacterium]